MTSYGHVNNVTYYSYFDTAVNEFLVRFTGLDYPQHRSGRDGGRNRLPGSTVRSAFPDVP